jgi:hypothetical protein
VRLAQILFVVAVVVALSASPALANAGVPMLVLVWPGLGVLLIPIIITEAVYARRLLHVQWSQAFLVSTKANVASALLGIPLAWAAMFVLEMAVFIPLDIFFPHSRVDYLVPLVGAAWLTGEGSPWQVPLAAAVLCLPFYLASVLIEARVASTVWSAADARRWSTGANQMTYAPIVLGLLLFTGWLAR